jgi:polyphenol oxidase
MPSSLPFLSSSAFDAPHLGLQYGFFTRQGGVSTGLYTSLNGGIGSKDTADHVLENRARIAATLGVTATNLLPLYQVHSPDVITVSAPYPAENRPKADALVTKTRGLALSIATADCGPVLFHDRIAGVIGAAHAGWRGALTGVLENTLSAMEDLGAETGRLHAVIGPCIHQAAYEVGAEFEADFTKVDASYARFFDPIRPMAYRFDLPSFIAMRLRAAGVEHVSDVNACTHSDATRFFSFRRATQENEPDYGRQISAIVLQ